MSESESNHRMRARYFVPALLLGWATIAYGAMAALDDRRDAHPVALLTHIVAIDLAHDLLIAPLLFLGAWAVGKAVPDVARGPVRAAAAATLLVSAIAYPLVHRWGQRPTNGSALPLNYGRNLAIIVVAIWTLAALVILRRQGKLQRQLQHAVPEA